MNDNSYWVLLAIGTLILGVAIGSIYARSSIHRDCQELGKFRSTDAVYVCKKEPKP